jgi:LysR family transcriptional regulator, transcription activator of glutamate synthase operon
VELRQLVYFEAVVRYGGFSAAADHLHIAQPAVSAQIRRLEAELGTPLLERTTRRVAVTHAGQLFLARARAILDQVGQARADLDELADVLRGRLRIGAAQGLASLDVPRLLSGFHRRYPGVTLALRTGLIAKLLRTLEIGELDVVLGPVHADLGTGFAAEPLIAEQILLVTPPGRALGGRASGGRASGGRASGGRASGGRASGGRASGGRASGGPAIRLDQVRAEPFVCLPSGSGLHAILLTAAEAAGFRPRIQFETYSPGSIRELVSAGLGVALLAASNARTPGPPIQTYELVDAPGHPPIGMIHHAERAANPVTRRWRAYVTEAYASPTS